LRPQKCSSAGAPPLSRGAGRRQTVTPVAEIDTLSTLRRAIASGLGDAILSWSALNNGDDGITLNYRRFADAKMVRPVALCFSEVGHQSPAAEAVALTLRALICDHVESGAWHGVSLIEHTTESSPSAVPAEVQDGAPAADALESKV
jgi:DNA-binding transcriptional LysR family regulator